VMGSLVLTGNWQTTLWLHSRPARQSSCPQVRVSASPESQAKPITVSLWVELCVLATHADALEGCVCVCVNRVELVPHRTQRVGSTAARPSINKHTKQNKQKYCCPTKCNKAHHQIGQSRVDGSLRPRTHQTHTCLQGWQEM
jgi:hypothetical protein